MCVFSFAVQINVVQIPPPPLPRRGKAKYKLTFPPRFTPAYWYAKPRFCMRWLRASLSRSIQTTGQYRMPTFFFPSFFTLVGRQVAINSYLRFSSSESMCVCACFFPFQKVSRPERLCAWCRFFCSGEAGGGGGQRGHALHASLQCDKQPSLAVKHTQNIVPVGTKNCLVGPLVFPWFRYRIAYASQSRVSIISPRHRGVGAGVRSGGGTPT